MSLLASANPVERPRVLLVEDDAAVRRSLQLLLRPRGLDVRAYASSMAALADLDTAPADCLVTDLVMPDVDGVALLNAMRERGWCAPAILITGHLNREASARAKQAGFDVVMTKPIGDAALVDAISRLLEQDTSAVEPPLS